MQVKFRANWSWTIRNEQNEPCHEIEDLTVCGTATFESDTISDINIEHVVGDYAERVGLSWHHYERELPSWLAEKALAAAKEAAGDSTGVLWASIEEDVRAEVETIDEDEDVDKEDL